jgi:hypothetical protein
MAVADHGQQRGLGVRGTQILEASIDPQDCLRQQIIRIVGGSAKPSGTPIGGIRIQRRRLPYFAMIASSGSHFAAQSLRAKRSQSCNH